MLESAFRLNQQRLHPAENRSKTYRPGRATASGAFPVFLSLDPAETGAEAPRFNPPLDPARPDPGDSSSAS
ncbi:MAG TPA: hypothetical protein VFE22_11045, partial [Edaphobacter sp.]|nr:hypothetical protein [Edaphobacter sp.]